MLTTCSAKSPVQHCLDHKLVYANEYDIRFGNVARTRSMISLRSLDLLAYVILKIFTRI